MAADTYTHGHHESVLRSHVWRTAENSAGYLLPRLQPGMNLLDVGCGPGTITLDLAGVVAPGQVLGIDTSTEVIEKARRLADDRGDSSTRFDIGDIYALDLPDDSVDVVHAHQVLQHLSDPVAALREMRRVAGPHGLVAVRDADYAAMTWFPAGEGLTAWLDVYHRVAMSNNAFPDAGRELRSWALAAGFTHVECSASAWCFAAPAERDWWGSLWATRCTESDFGKQAVERGFATDQEMTEIARAWHAWAQEDDAWFGVMHGEVLASG